MAFSPVDRALDPLFTLQAGLVGRGQVLDVGGTDDLIASRLRSGRWSRNRAGVYALAGADPGWARPHWSAVLGAGPRATVSHEAAAQLHGADLLSRGPTILTVPHPEHPRLVGVIVHQSTDLHPSHVIRMDGLPVTTPERTVMDLAAVVAPKALHAVGQELLIARKVSPDRLARMFASLSRPGKRGFGQLGAILDDLLTSKGVPESLLEAEFLELVRAGDLEEPESQHPFPGREPGAHRVDFAYVAERLIIEIDGRSFHGRHADMVRDRERDMALAAAGWQVVRIMWETLRDHPERVIDQLREILRHRRAA